MDILKKVRRREKIKARIHKKVRGTPDRPRISVFRSNKHIHAQLVDDLHGITLVSAHSGERDIEGTKTEKAFRVGALLAQRALEKGITRAVFDRGGYLYHGRVRSLAEGARRQGLQF
ncbi:MAG: 50S ribosomal protein L18 [Bacteroidia bacterium]